MEATQLDVVDPFLAYLVSIAASIHIEHSLSAESSITSAAKQKLATCLAYLERVSQVWPKVRKRIETLQALQARVRYRSALHYVEAEYDGAVPVRSVRQVSLSRADEQLMWTLFDSSNDLVSSTLHQAPMADGSGLRRHSLSGQSDSLASSAVAIGLSHAGSTAPLDANDATSIPARTSQHISAFDQIPYNNDLNVDWSLLGMPWPAYFPTDTSPIEDPSLP